MPARQREEVMRRELGGDWPSAFRSFDERPFAAASIGQCHRATLHDGRDVVVKVQYPGVADSIRSDIDNVVRLVSVTNMVPKGLYLEHAIEVAKEELALECDYAYEAAAQERFARLAADDPELEVPSVVPELSTPRIVTSTFLEGLHIDKCAGMPQSVRDRIGRLVLRVTLRELFEFRFMQTDPNYANFLFNAERDTLGMLDFGAAKEFPAVFVDEYGKLVLACADGDADGIVRHSISLGFLTGDESRAMLRSHVEAGLVVGRPFATGAAYDFGDNSQMTHDLVGLGGEMISSRLTSPPPEAYALHRRLSGAFLAAMKLRARIDCRELLLEQLGGAADDGAARREAAAV